MRRDEELHHKKSEVVGHLDRRKADLSQNVIDDNLALECRPSTFL